MRKIIVLSMVCGLWFMVAFAQEELTITTYYPSPSGSYNELRAITLRAGSLAIIDADGNIYPDNWIGMTDNIDGLGNEWLHIGGITDGGVRRLTLFANRTYISEDVGIGIVPAGPASFTPLGLGVARLVSQRAGNTFISFMNFSETGGWPAEQVGVGTYSDADNLRAYLGYFNPGWAPGPAPSIRSAGILVNNNTAVAGSSEEYSLMATGQVRINIAAFPAWQGRDALRLDTNAAAGQSYIVLGNTNELGIWSSPLGGNADMVIRHLTETSDSRLKTKISGLDSVLDNIGKIRGVKFEWKSSPGEKKIGVIAQEVEKFYPELVGSTNSAEGEYKTLNYSGFTAVLLEAIKEQQKQIEGMKEEIAVLKAKSK